MEIWVSFYLLQFYKDLLKLNLGGTIGNAVATSMNLTNSSEPMGESSTAPHYKLEPPSNDMMYYQVIFFPILDLYFYILNTTLLLSY